MKRPKYSVRIYPKAEADLLEIKDYFENKLKTSANGLFEKFFNQIDLLESDPFIHPLVQDLYLNEAGYRMIPIENFLVFYIIKGKEVQIHRFIYGKRNYLLLL
jgi:addiction module RelE/StbE family toxin